MTNAKADMLKFWGIDYVAADQTRQQPESEPHASQQQGNKQEELAQLEAEVKECGGCELCQSRTNVVFGEGNPDTDIFFVGEAPGFDEDQQGRPFVGRAGKLLDKIITAGMGLSRDDVYIGNILKCRPPGNRTPNPQEITACSPFLLQQIAIIRPKVIIALGAPSAQTLLETTAYISDLRGTFHDFQVPGDPDAEPVKLIPTYHPAYLLRNPSAKAKVWEDIKKVLKFLDLPIPDPKKS